MRTSELLKLGEVYTREELKKKFGIKDATINTGIFRPKDHESVWLFVTEKKTPDRTQYEDSYDGETLRIESQPSGRKDKLLIGHEQRGLEILLSYRKSKSEHDGYAFRYEGRFKYADHRGTHPAQFHFTRIP